MKNIKKTLIVITLVLIIGIMEVTNIIPIGLLQKNGATTVQAYTHNPDNILNNVYEKDGLTILPFIFYSPSQMIQKSFVIEQFQQAGISIKNQESLGSTIVTGNEIVTDNKTYTVLIFGDVDQNGTVNSFDALSIVEHIVYGKSSELKGICKLAANVENDSDNLDSFDALRIIEFVIGREKKLVLNEPESIAKDKLVPEYKVPEGLTATKGQTLADVKLPKGFTFAAPLDTPVGEVGTHTFTVIYTPEDTNKYQIVPGIKVTITVTEGTEKEKPIYAVPEGLTAIEGQTLREIDLPEGFKFEDPLDTLVGKAGENKFKVTYIPADTDKYEIVTGIEIIITVIESSVNPPEEDTEKITGIKKEFETQIAQNIYNERKVATIKSIDTEVMLAKDSNFVYSCDIFTNDGNKETTEVSFTKGSASGEIDINFYATKAGTYTLIPKVTGKKVIGTVKLPIGEEIMVTVNEDLTVTDIKLDGKLLPKDASVDATIVTRVGKTETPQIEFYHIYDDNKYNTTRKVKIENMLNTPVELQNTEACKTYLTDIAICGEDKQTVVVYDEEGKTPINPYCINIKGVLETTTNCSFDIKVTNIKEDGTKSAITRKINVSVIEKARSNKLKVGTSDINLYKNYPGSDSTDEIINSIIGTHKYHVVNNEEGKENYRVIAEDGKAYTIIPIELLDEFDQEVKITIDQISKMFDAHNSTEGNKIVVLGNDGQKNVDSSLYIDIKPFAKYEDSATKKDIYYKATNKNDDIKAIGIALQNDEYVCPIDMSISFFNSANIKGFKIGYNGLDGTETSAKVKRKTTDLIKTSIDETANNNGEDIDNDLDDNIGDEIKKNILEVGVSKIGLYKDYPGSDVTDKIVKIHSGTYKYHEAENEDGIQYRVVNEGGKTYTIVPIEMFDEFGKEAKILGNQILDYDDPKIQNRIVVLGNDGKKNVESAIYIDVKPFARYEDLATKQVVYYKATNANDDIKAIGIALENDEYVCPIDMSISFFNTNNIKRI